MKNLLLSSIAVLLILSCERKECCTIVDAFVDISVIEKATNKDLLNQSDENHYDIKNIKLAFSVNPDQKVSIDAIQTSKPLFFKNGEKYFLRLFPTTSESLGETHSVTIYWTDTNADKVTFHLKTNGTTTITEEILVNDVLKWETSKGYKEITILK
jgi:hypothetical protein